MIKPDFTPAFSKSLGFHEMASSSEIRRLANRIGPVEIMNALSKAKHVTNSYLKLLRNGQL